MDRRILIAFGIILMVILGLWLFTTLFPVSLMRVSWSITHKDSEGNDVLAIIGPNGEVSSVTVKVSWVCGGENVDWSTLSITGYVKYYLVDQMTERENMIVSETIASDDSSDLWSATKDLYNLLPQEDANVGWQVRFKGHLSGSVDDLNGNTLNAEDWNDTFDIYYYWEDPSPQYPDGRFTMTVGFV